MNPAPPTNPKIQKSKNLMLWLAVLVALSFIAYKIGTYVWIFHNMKIGAEKILDEADGGFSRAKNEINPEQLRVWALECIESRNNLHEVYKSMPESIRNLYAESPDVSVDKSCVSLSWGGGFFHWYINIGTTNYTELTGAHNNYTTAKWVPGIYYGREDMRHPIQ